MAVRQSRLNRQTLGKLLVGSGVALLLGTIIVLANTGPFAPAVPLRTGDQVGAPRGAPGGLPLVGCYTSGVEGLLVKDADAGVAILEPNGHRSIITWPQGYTARRSWWEVEVIDRSGNVVVRTGTQVNLPGGYGPDGTFQACGDVAPNA